MVRAEDEEGERARLRARGGTARRCVGGTSSLGPRQECRHPAAPRPLTKHQIGSHYYITSKGCSNKCYSYLSAAVSTSKIDALIPSATRALDTEAESKEAPHRRLLVSHPNHVAALLPPQVLLAICIRRRYLFLLFNSFQLFILFFTVVFLFHIFFIIILTDSGIDTASIPRFSRLPAITR
jgi:hypothetical protein